MNLLIFIKHVEWIEKRCKLIVISDDQAPGPVLYSKNQQCHCDVL